MQLTDQHIEYIQKDLELRGITMNELNESLVDHLCCAVESSKLASFEEAYLQALSDLGGQKINHIQKQTTFLLTSKNTFIMKKTFFILGYLAAFLTSTGILFKTMHWPGANILLVSGITIFNLGFLPMYFINRYKQAIN